MGISNRKKTVAELGNSGFTPAPIRRGGLVRAFTLIELLVVISIIGLLSSVVLASLSAARVNARDARRMSDLNEIRNALELYFADHGYYPQAGTCYAGGGTPTNGGNWDCNGYRFSYDSSSWGALAADLAPYLPTLPVDPVNSNCNPWTTGCYSYSYGNVGRTTYTPQYDLTAQLEGASNPNRCAVRNYHYYFSNIPWCGVYSSQIYEASPI